jgi:gliding motility-associated-like protein
MRTTLILIFLLLVTVRMQAQLDSPALICDSVNQDGSVTLIWEQVPDPGGIFTGYSVFYRPDPASSFTQVGLVTDIAQVTYRHAGANANDRSRFYYVQAESTMGPSGTSDTIETIFLYYETDDDENISLFWNALHDPPLPTPNVRYLVYREYPPGNLELLTNTQNLTYDHHFWFCNKEQSVVNFQIITQDFSTGCQSTSNIYGGVLSNLSQPDMPSMDSVSVNPGGGVSIGWQPGTASDIAGYVIYRVTAINDSIAFVPGMDSTFFIDVNADPCSGSYSYSIASIDSCGNKSPGTFSSPHSTIYLDEIQYDPCFLANTLNWTAYDNFTPPLAGYEIFVSIDGGAYSLLDTVDFWINTYEHQGLLANTNYSYFIRAFSNGHAKTSTSCTHERRTFNSPVPEYLYLRYSSVEGENSVDLSFYADTAAHLRLFEIYRSDGPAAAFTLVGTLDPALTDVYYFTDDLSGFPQQSYYYVFSAIDSCGNAHTSGNLGRTIFLQVASTESLTNVLSWNAYELWDAGVGSYSIFRRTGNGGAAQEVGSTSPGELTFTDDISGLTGTGGVISYYVEAYEARINQYGFSDTARSNEVMADVIEKVFLPNAFVPKGVNSTFKPVGNFISEENYLFTIYNRWGQQLFETTNPSEAWDGQYKGKYVPQDVYVYILRFTTATGDVVLKKGNVTVIF